MQVEIKREKPGDREEVDLLFKLVFEQEGISPMIQKLRQSDIFIPELSRVARIKDSIIGIIMYTKGAIVRGRKQTPTVVLSSLAVLPSYQGLGVGGELIRNSFIKARKMEVETVLVFGQDEYFTKFGFSPASDYEISASLDISDEEFLALELVENSLTEARGHLKNHPLYAELLQFNF